MIAWPLWEQRRIAELQAGGMPPEVARCIGKAETVNRQRISRCIGWRRARTAELDCVVTGETVKFVIIGGLAGLTPAQRQRLFALPNLSPMITP
ncbi:hypothetical protein ASE82_10840 [Sphingomonas sp. Leaf230]|uniref:hypothetical protein n=1 Tax=Sphingomonas sp. Leaf230 TaxID=1735694 RepID=UPI0006FA39C2|nr:hypothetical protein [Sphingomonas sp. Leaf230]KQN02774.1 hypothetical protein ASE82_10840 [Sphingomonas sp. Leaf230]